VEDVKKPQIEIFIIMGLTIVGVLTFIMYELLADRRHFADLKITDITSQTSREKLTTNRNFLATTEMDLMKET
jgi:hypothetical protein